MDDGGPAFPHDTPFHERRGMSLRDWFAGQALAGILANGRTLANSHDQAELDRFDMLVAGRCYDVADAMLKAREA